jgi:hypothetical protein
MGGGAAPQFTIGPITVGSAQSLPITPNTITGGGGGGGTFTPITPHTITGGGGGGTFTPITPNTITGGGTFTPVTGGTFTPITGGTFHAAGMGGGAAPQFTIGPVTVGSQQSFPFTQTVTFGGNSLTLGATLNTFSLANTFGLTR